MQTSNLNNKNILQRVSNCIRYLSVCMVEKANSGHPGMPLGASDIVSVLFSKFLQFSTKNPKWINRDRFVLSAGHASAMLYSTLFLFGYKDIDIEDIKNFRQINSKTAGHPEYGYLDGIESTTGPLGQGFANAVGMAIAQKKFESEIGSEYINNKTYVLVGDGCLQEGISFEAAEIAGHLKLQNLIAIYDSNHITIDGGTSSSISSSTKTRFVAHGWNVIECDGHNLSEIERSLILANQHSGSPSIIICTTKIGFASKKEGSEETHGSPIKGDDLKYLANNLGIDYEKFSVPDDVAEFCKNVEESNNNNYEMWLQKLTLADKGDIVEHFINTKPSITNDELTDLKTNYFTQKISLATRNLGGDLLAFLQNKYNCIIAGSADLAKSTCFSNKNTKAISKDDFSGNYIHYGIREHAMGAVMNGIFLYGVHLPLGSTFLTFSDYVRPAIRLSAIMQIGVIYVFTHDSFFVGEDGPTHQPIEHISSLRAIPNVNLFRPCDGVEVAECYQIALENKNSPSIFTLSRQSIKMIRDSISNSNSCSKGAYIIKPSSDLQNDTYRIIASGAEVELANEVCKLLNNKGILASVVSVPCLELFCLQSHEYQNKIFGDKNVIRIFIEAANLMSYYKHYNPERDKMIDITTFGLSGKDIDLANFFGYTAEKIISKINI